MHSSMYKHTHSVKWGQFSLQLIGQNVQTAQPCFPTASCVALKKLCRIILQWWPGFCNPAHLSARLRADVAQISACSSMCHPRRLSGEALHRVWRRSLSLCLFHRGFFPFSVLWGTASGSPCSAAHSQARRRQNGQSRSKGTHRLQAAHCIVRVRWYVHSNLALWLHPKQTPWSSGETVDSESPQRESGRWHLRELLERCRCQLQGKNRRDEQEEPDSTSQKIKVYEVKRDYDEKGLNTLP